MYTRMQHIKKEIDIKQELIQQSYEFVERMNVLMQDYVIDYEEYFNRQMVGCTSAGGKGDTFTWQTGTSGHCTEFSAYGNQNGNFPSLSISTNLGRQENHALYYCTSKQGDVLTATPYTKPVVYEGTGNNCIPTSSTHGNKQSYGQYAKLFFDVKSDTDGDNSLVGDSDDEDRGI
ncbi:MAG: hypothetical protein LBH96_02335 [Candidatus Peribacteria bacterium]|nr:hypothetical protein [Candidatus Peribacteria bacterium]